MTVYEPNKETATTQPGKPASENKESNERRACRDNKTGLTYERTGQRSDSTERKKDEEWRHIEMCRAQPRTISKKNKKSCVKLFFMAWNHVEANFSTLKFVHVDTGPFGF